MGLILADSFLFDFIPGIGYFTLPYLVYTGVKHLHACEWNPDAVEALRRNLRLNGVEDRCTVHVGDNRKVICFHCKYFLSTEPRHKKTCLRGFRPDKTRTGQLSYRVQLES